MKNDRDNQSVSWESLAFVTGGLLMAALWIVYTNVHGPTSFDQTRLLFGRSTLFWGLLLSVLPSLFIVLGLILLYPGMARGIATVTRIGYTLTMISLVVPAGVDLFVWGGIGPPFFVPVVGIGIILLALGSRHSHLLSRSSSYLLMFVGVCQVIAFALVLIPQDVSDRIGGYRIYGFIAHLLTGVGWAVFGVNLWKTRSATIVRGISFYQE